MNVRLLHQLYLIGQRRQYGIQLPMNVWRKTFTQVAIEQLAQDKINREFQEFFDSWAKGVKYV